MSDIFDMRGITVFHPKILLRYQFHCRHAHENVPYIYIFRVLAST